jgi:hypothetical protein
MKQSPSGVDHSLVVKHPDTFLRRFQRRLSLAVGWMITKLYNAFEFYQIARVQRYDFVGSRQTVSTKRAREKYVDDAIYSYQDNQESLPDLERSSQYFLFKKIEEETGAKKTPLKICNIGCFYCASDNHFLEKRPSATVYGLDYGNIQEVNRNFKNKNLKLFEGYPLETLEKLGNESGFEMFDYALFTRTATIINPNELLSYMEALKKIARCVMFLEVVKLATYTKAILNIKKIDIMRPIKIYKGMYIHNYPKVLERAGYKVTDQEILPYNAFNQQFTHDHFFIYARGDKAS